MVERTISCTFTALAKPALGCKHQPTSQAAAALILSHGEVVDPTAVPVMSDHRSADQTLTVETSENRGCGAFQGPPQVKLGRIPRAGQSRLLPYRNSCLNVNGSQIAELHKASLPESFPLDRRGSGFGLSKPAPVHRWLASNPCP